MIQAGKFDQQPFYSGDCVSIKMGYRTVDLVIPDREDLWALLRLLQIHLEKDAIFHVKPGDTDKVMQENRLI
jgi:hypothetical protein